MSRTEKQLSQLRAILAHSKKLRLANDPQQFFEDCGFDLRGVEEWRYELNEIEGMFPREAKRLSGSYQVDLQRIYACGEIQGTVETKGSIFHVFLSFEHSPSPAGCSCVDSSGREPCVHSYAFLKEVVERLGKDEHLIAQIQDGNLLQDKPPRKQLRPDQSEMAMRALDDLIQHSSKIRSHDSCDGEDTLPPLSVQAESRICWDITVSCDGYLQISPLLQQRKKRGSGYTKGRALPLARLITDRSLPYADGDQDVIACIQTRASYYGNDYELEPVDAIDALLNAGNVTFEGSPIAVKPYPGVVGLARVDGKLRMGFVNVEESQMFPRMIVNNGAVLRFNRSEDELLFCRLSQREQELIYPLFQLPEIDAAHESAMLDRLRHLQGVISIQLPESNAGEIEIYDATPALLLRSRADGRLDYGIRVRDADGRLHRPLRGPMVLSMEVGGQLKQFVRSPLDEQATIKRLVSDWDLEVDAEDWFGTIADFEDGLRLLERLQSPDGEFEVLWDKSSEKPVTVLGSLSSKNVRVDIKKKRDWFGITGECQFGNQSLSLEDLLGFLPASDDEPIGEYVSLGDGQWARISAGLRRRLQRLRDATHHDRRTLKLDATAAPAVRDLVDSDVSIKATKAWEKCIERLAKAETLDPEIPETLDANLRDYQVEGYKWLRKLAEWGVGGVLADDMGLGKTLQTLGVLLDRSNEGPALVIAPTSVGFNWVREAERFAPDLNVSLYRETGREHFLKSVGPRDLVVCSYGLALRDQKALATVEWTTLVLDEAQAIKNSRSKTSKAIASLNADWCVALTGTPVENHLGELWSLFGVVSPGVFGGWDNFRKRYALPIEKENDEDASRALASRLKPFVLRRTKSEVLTELPARTEMTLYVDLSSEERAEYEKVRMAALGEVDQIETLPHLKDQRFKILALMTRLRQIACHAGLVNKDWKGSSAKLDQLCETLENLRKEGHRALVFSQFTEHLGLIRERIEQRGFTYEYLDGSTPAASRQQAVDRFQDGDANAFLISLKAGGTGLNLTAADYVIHMDPWWNPAVEDQATDRAHRMGQEKPVMVYRIVARGTIEEEILALHDSKRDLVAGVMEGTQAAAKLTNEDLIRMLRSSPDSLC